MTTAAMLTLTQGGTSMKILHLLATLDPRAGGPIEGVRQSGVEMASLGHQVEVVSLDAPDAPFIAAFPLPVHALGPARGNYGYTSRLVPWLREHAPRYDAVIVNGLWQYHSFGAWRALSDLGVRYYVFAHGMLDPWFKHAYPLKHLKKWLYWPWGEYRVLRDARAVLFTTEEERMLARQSFRLYRAHERVVSFGTAAPPSTRGGASRSATTSRNRPRPPGNSCAATCSKFRAAASKKSNGRSNRGLCRSIS